MDIPFGLFSAFSIFYAVILTILFLGKGFRQVIWPVILLICFFKGFDLEINPETGMYVINETLVPEWIFHPMNFVVGLMLALIISISIRWGQIDAGG